MNIDYTPRNPTAKRHQERVVLNTVVYRQALAPFFEVHVAGHSVCFTDSRSEAHSALKDGFTYPRVLTMVDVLGRRTLLERISA